MNIEQKTSWRYRSRTKWMIGMALTTLALGCYKSTPYNPDFKNFEQVNLVANSSAYNPVTVDPTLQNAFGVAWSPTGVAWVNSVGGHVSELYSGDGAIVRKPVHIPRPVPNDSTGGLPTGIVFSGGKGFNLPNGPSVFLFAGFDGVLSGWNPASGNNAAGLKKAARSNYTGLAIASNNGHNLIYAANFGANRIDVWDTAFSEVIMSFRDPGMPAEYSPYNIQSIGEKLFVMYAQLSNTGGMVGHVAGAGKGFVSIFNTDGSFVKRFASRGTLNIPWGITQAPASFLAEHDMHVNENLPVQDGGQNSGNNTGNQYPKQAVLLVGNFGDGHINVYSLNGEYLGQLQAHDHAVVIDGLWALSFAPTTSASMDKARLYFTAGPNSESDGLFGYLIKK